MEPEVLSIFTDTGEPVANQFLPHEEPAGVAIFLPGRGYGATQPPVYFLMEMLAARGYDTMSLRYWYQVQDVAPNPEADPQAEEAGYIRALEEARAAVRAVLQRRDYKDILLIGKSYGTAILNDLCLELPELGRARLVHLTPIFPHEGFAEKFRRTRQPALLVLGTLDPCYNSVQLEDLARARDFRLTVLPNVHHGLEDPDDYRNSIRLIETICAAVEAFIDG